MIGAEPHVEEAYLASIAPALEAASGLEETDIVVGIPFGSADRMVPRLCRSVTEGFARFFPGKRCVLVCVGSHDAGELVREIEQSPQGTGVRRLAFLMADETVSRRIRKTRSVMELADRLNADLAMLEPGGALGGVGQGTEGVAMEWISRILAPLVQDDIGLVLPSFNADYLHSPAGAHLVRPLLASIFRVGTTGATGTVFGVSYRLLRAHLSNPTIWSDRIGDHGIFPWLLIATAAARAGICESRLGMAPGIASIGDDAIWREQTQVLFDAVARARDWWGSRGVGVYRVAVFGETGHSWPEEAAPEIGPLVDRLRTGFSEFEGLYSKVLSRDVTVALRMLAGSDAAAFEFPADLWAEVVYDFLLCYCLEEEFAKDVLLNAFVPLCYGRVAGFGRQVRKIEATLREPFGIEANRLATALAESEIEIANEAFISRKAQFAERWNEREKTLQPILPRVTYREFIPGVPLIVPKELTSLPGKTVSTDAVYNKLVKSYREEFRHFVYDRLGVPEDAGSAEIGEKVKGLMLQLERDLGEALLTGDLLSLEGTRAIVGTILDSFSHSKAFTLRPEVSSWILHRNPPGNLLIKCGTASLSELERQYAPNDILALSGLTEDAAHTARVWDWIAGNARPDHFDLLTVEAIVENHESFPMLAQMMEPSTLGKLSGRVVVSNLRPGAGGGFPQAALLLDNCQQCGGGRGIRSAVGAVRA
jgi:hypothetical protein